MKRASRALAAILGCVFVALSSTGCKLTATRPDQDAFVLNTSGVPVEQFLEALRKRLAGAWEAPDYAPPDADRSKMYTFEGNDVTAVLVPMPHDRCNPNGRHHLTYDPAYRVELVYRTSAPAIREAAKRKLFEAASDVGEHLVRFAEYPK
jgi:hypothetical protein